MSYTIEEKSKDRYSEDSSGVTIHGEYELIADDAMTRGDATAHFMEYVPRQKAAPSGALLGISSFDVEVEDESLDRKWNCVVEWTSDASGGGENAEYPEEPVIMETFTTEGGTARITQAMDETRYSIDGNMVPDMRGGIGWNGDKFEGCDVVCPAFSFTLEKTYTDMTSADKTALANVTGKVNLDSFRGYDAGTVLFMGVSGQTEVCYDGTLVVIGDTIYRKATVKYKCRFAFRCQPNVQLNVAGTAFNKGGWQYYWVLRHKDDDSSSKMTVETPIGVYVNTVYRMTSFADLL